MDMINKYEKELSSINERAKKDIESYTKAFMIAKEYILSSDGGFFKSFRMDDFRLSFLPSVSDLVSVRNGFLYEFTDARMFRSIEIFENVKCNYEAISTNIDHGKKMIKDIINDEPKVYEALKDICGIEKRVLDGLSDDELSISRNKPYIPKSKYFKPAFVTHDIYTKLIDKEGERIDIYNKYYNRKTDNIIPYYDTYSMYYIVKMITRRIDKLASLIRFCTSELNNLDTTFNTRLGKELNKDLEKNKNKYKIVIEELKSMFIRLKSKYNSLLSNELIRDNIIDGVL